MEKRRKENDRPLCIEKWGWKYHHLGIPTSQKFPDEQTIPKYEFSVSGFETSPFGIEWMRFETNSPIHKLIQEVPHVAFEVGNLDYEIKHRGLKVIVQPTRPAQGIRVAMIEHNGAPIELIEFEKKSMNRN